MHPWDVLKTERKPNKTNVREKLSDSRKKTFFRFSLILKGTVALTSSTSLLSV